ncbi:hypothetical protein BDV93DRAFT_521941 [Ceratobasidium sp. AG-I]|nr:hypothetical protein BDV93DRAFT_521941 [Ceratobasidium sp. AG-I]
MSGGTQSPPLENTGEHQPIGAAGKSGEPLKEGVKDSVQRSGYFGGDGKSGQQATDSGSGISDAAISSAENAGQNIETKQST